MGSFLSMLTYRLPKGMDIIIKPSHCSKCKNALYWNNLIPIISYIFQKGKCSSCHKKIFLRYPVIEIISTVIFIISHLMYSEFSWFYAITYWCLFGMIITDIENLMIPDFFQIIFLTCGLYYIYEIYYLDLYSQLLNSGAIFLFFIILRYSFLIIRKTDAIGFADIKFLTIAGLFSNFAEIPFLIGLSGLFGIIFGLIWRKIYSTIQFPFIPCIIISFVIILNKLIYIIFQ